jgi:hypothetical protein
MLEEKKGTAKLTPRNKKKDLLNVPINDARYKITFTRAVRKDKETLLLSSRASLEKQRLKTSKHIGEISELNKTLEESISDTKNEIIITIKAIDKLSSMAESGLDMEQYSKGLDKMRRDARREEARAFAPSFDSFLNSNKEEMDEKKLKLESLGNRNYKKTT